MEKAIIIGVNTLSEDYVFLDEIEELKNLCLACDVEIVDVITQNLNYINPSTYVGKGKIEEIKITVQSLDIEALVFNDELTPLQITNLQEALEIIIYDRTFIILEIFKRRAKTKEAMMQVEIATLKYSLPRLTGLRKGLSRQRGTGGGFAHGRGAGETKLELDRRITTDRITALKKELEEVTLLRKQQRKTRKTNNMQIVCLVGYTNSGKSSTLNALLHRSKGIKKTVFEKDMLFTTLETSTRAIQTETNFHFLVTDTVGFVNKLPHHLVEAFKSTLEEIKEADLIIHVVDATNHNYKSQIETTEQVLQSIGVKNIPTIYAFNKIDLLEDYLYIQPQYEKAIRISAITDKNIDKLIEMIQTELEHDFVTIQLHVPYHEQKIIEFLKGSGYTKAIDYQETQIEVLGKIPKRLLSKVKKYL